MGGGEKLFIKNSDDKIIGFNFESKNIISREIVSDENGMIIIEDVEGYKYLNAVAFNQNQPLNVIRFGDNLYIGYYGGATTPSTSTPTDLLFTSISGVTTTVYYISEI